MAYMDNQFSDYKYDDILDWLQERSSVINAPFVGSIFTADPEDVSSREFSCPENATGLDLLSVFTRMVTDEEFIIKNSYTQKIHGRWEAVKDHLMFKIKIKTKIVDCLCGATENQPGNAIIENYGIYQDHETEFDENNFPKYFENFLNFEMNPPEVLTTDWKVAVLLLFEIARRIPIDDIYRHIPVAIGIQMALQLPIGTITTGEFFDLFRGRQREMAFRRITDKYVTLVDPTPNSTELLEPFGYLQPLPQEDDEVVDHLANNFGIWQIGPAPVPMMPLQQPVRPVSQPQLSQMPIGPAPVPMMPLQQPVRPVSQLQLSQMPAGSFPVQPTIPAQVYPLYQPSQSPPWQ